VSTWSYAFVTSRKGSRWQPRRPSEQSGALVAAQGALVAAQGALGEALAGPPATGSFAAKLQTIDCRTGASRQLAVRRSNVKR
jgi:hypothetical protein